MAGTAASATVRESGAAWDTAYELKTVVLLALGFGLVGLDRWIIADLAGFSSMAPDLGLNAADVGNLISGLGIAWGVSAFFLGNLSDVIGRKKVLVSALVVFSLLSAFSGLASGFAMMLGFRVLMGGAEGAFCPTSFAAVAEASKPARRGFNLGFQEGAFSLIGLGLAPIITSQMVAAGLSWRWVFAIVGVPGLALAVLVAMTIREPATIRARRGAQTDANSPPKLSASAMFSHRNVALSMLALVCAMCGIFVLSAFIPTYLTAYLGLMPREAGFIAGAIGFGGFTGAWSLSALSDLLGRKAVALAGFLLGAGFLYLFMRLGPENKLLLFAVLFACSAFALGLLCLITGPIASEAAPLGMMAGTTGAIVAAGEIFGGGVAPAVGGYIAQHFGVQNTLWLALGGLMAGVVVSLFYRETAPRLAKRGQGSESALDRYEDEHSQGIV